MFFSQKKFFAFCLGLLLTLSLAAVASGVLAQTTATQSADYYGADKLTNVHLGTANMVDTVVNAINWVLGFLVLIAVIIILYGGFRWMTAGGNTDTIDTAKKIIINGTIGLVIVLASWSIVALVMRFWGESNGGVQGTACSEVGAIKSCSANGCDGTQVCQTDKTWSACQNLTNCPADTFNLTSTLPPSGQTGVIRNIILEFNFNNKVDTSTADNKILITKHADGSTVSGTISYNNNNRQIRFTPDTACPGDYGSKYGKKCLEENTQYDWQVAASLQDSAGHLLTCSGLNSLCTGTFTTGSLIDLGAPTVQIIEPVGSVAQSTAAKVRVLTKDDTQVRSVKLFYKLKTAADWTDGGLALNTTPSSDGTFVAEFSWNTASYPLKAHYLLKAEAADLDTNTGYSAEYEVVVRAAHCFNENKDSDEAGTDCGGNDCAACSGSKCSAQVNQCQADNTICASNYCDPDDCLCQDLPRIDWLSPDNGKVGNTITIGGKYFGSTPGQVQFLTQGCAGSPSCGEYDQEECNGSAGQYCQWLNGQCSAKTNACTAVTTQSECQIRGCTWQTNSTVAADIAFPSICSTKYWRDDQVVVKVPAAAQTGAIKLTRSDGKVDDTQNARGWLGVFTLNNIERPSLFCLNPEQGKAGGTFDAYGQNFGNDSQRGVTFGAWPNLLAAGAASYTSDKVVVQAPALLGLGTSYLRAYIERIYNGATVRDYSNYLGYKVNQLVGKKAELSGFSPTAGAPGTYVTITGSNFGSSRGTNQVYFTSSNQTLVAADYVFPAECGSSLWQDTRIIVKVPAGAANGPITVQTEAGTVDSSSLSENNRNFTVNTTLTPGICDVRRNSQTIKTAPLGADDLVIYGENFGEAKGQVKFTAAQNGNEAVTASNWNVAGNTNGTARQISGFLVPTTAVSGSLWVTNASQASSNPWPLTISKCQTDNDCSSFGTSYVCCASGRLTGVCKAGQSQCQGQPNMCSLDWRVITSGGYPTVVEECDRTVSCGENQHLPSPTPAENWRQPILLNGVTYAAKESEDACVNAVVSARFASQVTEASLNSNTIKIEQCLDGRTCSKTSANLYSSFKKEVFTASGDNAGGRVSNGFALSPNSTFRFAANSWYRVTLVGKTDNVKQAISDNSVINNSLSALNAGLSDYVWYFKTRTNTTDCVLGCTETVPDPFTTIDKNEKLKYWSYPIAQNNVCTIIDPQKLDTANAWAWSSNQTAKATVAANTKHGETPVSVLKEDKTTDPVKILATAQNSVQDFGRLYIDFSRLFVQNQSSCGSNEDLQTPSPYPDTSNACTNAVIYARFNRLVDTTSVVWPTGSNQPNLWVERCNDKTCSSAVVLRQDVNAPADLVTGVCNYQIIGLNSSQSALSVVCREGTTNLNPETWYRVVIKGGDSGLKSEVGGTLARLNFSATKNTFGCQTDYSCSAYAWRFATSGQVCRLQSIKISPRSYTASVLEEAVNFLAVPVGQNCNILANCGGDDKCSAHTTQSVCQADNNCTWLQTTKNYVNNSSLENWSASNLPTAWSINGAPVITKELSVVHLGSWSGKVSSQSTGNFGGLQYVVDNSVKQELAGKSVTFAAWVYNPTSNHAPNQIKDANGNYLYPNESNQIIRINGCSGQKSISIERKDSWQQVSYKCTMPTDLTTNVSWRMEHAGAAAGDWFVIDDLSIMVDNQMSGSCLAKSQTCNWQWGTANNANNYYAETATPILSTVNTANDFYHLLAKNDTDLPKGHGPVKVNVTETNNNKTAIADLTIKFTGFWIIENWPHCDTACINALIGSRFSQDYKVSTLTSDNVSLYKCSGSDCSLAGASLVALNRLWPTVTYPSLAYTSWFDYAPVSTGSVLEKNTYYRVVVKGGAQGIHSTFNEELQGLNFSRAGFEECDPAVVPWKDQTNACDSNCQLNRNFSFCTLRNNCQGEGCTRLRQATCDLDATHDPRRVYCNSNCLNLGNTNLAACGNGLVEKGEDCDDGNTVDGDGCSSRCLNEGSSVNSLAAKALCNNGTLEKGEECEPNIEPWKSYSGACNFNTCLNVGNTNTNFITNASLENWTSGLPTGWTKNGTVTLVEETSLVHSGSRAAKLVSVADSGLYAGLRYYLSATSLNQLKGKGVTAIFWVYNPESNTANNQLAWLFGCGGSQSQVGITLPRKNSWQRYILSCQLASNATVAGFRVEQNNPQAGEYVIFDDVQLENSAPQATCGDGIIQPGEDCDDGNTVNGDGCSAICLNEGNANLAACGNKVLEYGEDCDDGNTVNGDGCSSRCLFEVSAPQGNSCGDGVLAKNDSYSWIFKTQNNFCQLGSVSCTPTPQDYLAVNTTLNHLADSRSKPDNCDSNGQRLNPTFYQWGWNTPDAKVSIINYTSNASWKVSSQSNQALAEAAVNSSGKRATSQVIDKATGPLDGQAYSTPVSCLTNGTCCQVGLQCGYTYTAGAETACPNISYACNTTNHKCTVNGEEKTNSLCYNNEDCKYEVGSDTCCWARPTVNLLYPNTSPACPNTVLSATFSQEMNTDTLTTDNVSLEICSAKAWLINSQSWWGRALTWLKQAAGNFLPWPFSVQAREDCVKVTADGQAAYRLRTYSTTDDNGDKVTKVEIIPNTQLKVNTRYRLIVYGQISNLAITPTSKKGLTMYSDRYYDFTTESSVCKIAQVNIAVAPGYAGSNYNAPAVKTADTFFCSSNNCAYDQESALPGNQHIYLAQAVDKEQNLILAKYTWQQLGANEVLNVNLAPSGQASAADNNKLMPTANNKNGETALRVWAADPYDSQNYAQQDLAIQVFLCNNPWPSPEAFPWRDQADNCNISGQSCNNYNFSFYYCRDKGSQETNDDLPDLSYLVRGAENSNTGFLKSLETFTGQLDYANQLTKATLEKINTGAGDGLCAPQSYTNSYNGKAGEYCGDTGYWDYQFTITKAGEYSAWAESSNASAVDLGGNSSDSRLGDLSAKGIYDNIEVLLKKEGEDDSAFRLAGTIKNLASWPQMQKGSVKLGNLTVGNYVVRFNFTNPTQSYFVLYSLGLLPQDSQVDVVGIRVYRNSDRLSPAAWFSLYAPNPSGSMTETTVDGYLAGQVGKTTYINAVNQFGKCYNNGSLISDSSCGSNQECQNIYGSNASCSYTWDSSYAGQKNLYANTYVVSVSQNAKSDTLNIYNQLLKNFSLNTNLTDLQICSNDISKICNSDFDCADGGTCQADKSKVRRDLRRVMDQNTIKGLLNSYATQNNNTYPNLAAGSFLRNYSASIWSRSWNSELGNALGTALPADPLNQIKSCPIGICLNNKNVSCRKDQDCVDNSAGSTCALYEQSTCWNRAWLDFQCPAGSAIYLYSWNNNNPKLYSRFEYPNAVWKGTTNISVGSATLSNPCGASNCQCFNYSLNVK